MGEIFDEYSLPTIRHPCLQARAITPGAAILLLDRLSARHGVLASCATRLCLFWFEMITVSYKDGKVELAAPHKPVALTNWAMLIFNPADEGGGPAKTFRQHRRNAHQTGGPAAIHKVYRRK